MDHLIIQMIAILIILKVKKIIKKFLILMVMILFSERKEPMEMVHLEVMMIKYNQGKVIFFFNLKSFQKLWVRRSKEIREQLIVIIMPQRAEVITEEEEMYIMMMMLTLKIQRLKSKFKVAKRMQIEKVLIIITCRRIPAKIADYKIIFSEINQLINISLMITVAQVMAAQEMVSHSKTKETEIPILAIHNNKKEFLEVREQEF